MKKMYAAFFALAFTGICAWAEWPFLSNPQSGEPPAAQSNAPLTPANITITCAPLTVPCLLNDFTPDTLFQKYGLSASFPTTAGGSGSLILSYQDSYQELDCQDVVNGIPNLAAHISRTWTAVDSDGATASCTQDIYIRRIALDELQWIDSLNESCLINFVDIMTPPFIVFQNVRLELHPGNNVCSLNAMAVDNLIPGPCDGSLVVSRVWTIEDACAPFNPDPNYTGQLIFSQYILLEDKDGPQFACPQSATLIIPDSACAYNLTFDPVTVSSNCSSIDSFVVQLSGGPQPLRYKAVLDPILPPIEVLALPGTQALATGNYTVTYTAFDNCGMTSSCSFNLVAYDTIRPQIQFNAFTDSIPVSLVQVPAQLFDNGSSDHCGTKIFFKARRKHPTLCQNTFFFHDFIRICCEDAGDTLDIEFRIYDRPLPPGPVKPDTLLAHARTATGRMALFDLEAPFCTPAPDIAVSCAKFDATLAGYPLGVYGDNCCLDSSLTYLNNIGVSGSADYTAFDSICNQGVITRSYAVRDCHGNQTLCSDRIVVVNTNDYYLRFPSDTLVYSCQDSLYSGDIAFGNAACQQFAISYADTRDTALYPDQSRLIRRLWTVRNECRYDPDIPCIQVPNPDTLPGLPSILTGPTLAPDSAAAPWQPSVLFAAPGDTAATAYSQYWSDTANCYQYEQLIVVRDTVPPVFSTACPIPLQIVCFSDTNNPLFWNDPLFRDVAHNFASNLCEGGASLSTRATDLCSDVSYAAILSLDLNGDGIAESRIDTRNLPAPGTILFGNINGAGQIATIDSRAIPDDDKIQLAIVSDADSVVLQWREGSTFNPLFLPAGKHNIRWVATDEAGNSAFCEQTFELKDCAAPVPQCVAGAIIELPVIGPYTLTTDQLYQSLSDNCTPDSLIRTGVRRSGMGTGFPFSANNPAEGQQSILLSCADLGPVAVELWAIDRVDNADFCEVSIIVGDPLGACDPNNPIGGYVRTADGKNVAEVLVSVTDAVPPVPNMPNLNAITDADGFYSLANLPPLVLNSSFRLTPYYNLNHLNGVTTFDLVLINKHILSQELLVGPYRLISADANKSGTITTFDIVELRKLILGIYLELPNVASWRFVPQSFVFGNPENPWDGNFPLFKEFIAIETPNNLLDNLDFVAIKVGDVNNSATPLAGEPSDERAVSWVSARLTPDARDQSRARLRLTPPPGLSAWQGTLEWPEGVQLLQIAPGARQTLQHFGRFADALTWAIHDSEDGFELLLQTNDPILWEQIRLSDRITQALTYDHAGRESRPILFFEKKHSSAFELLPPAPNPWTQTVALGFVLSQAGSATLRVSDKLGREVWRERRDIGEGGPQAFILDASKISQPGLYYYSIETAEGSGSGRFVRSNR
ncbi:MAG: hypothetical protein ACK4NS_03380 [Saprospiraceae bacterium]